MAATTPGKGRDELPAGARVVDRDDLENSPPSYALVVEQPSAPACRYDVAGTTVAEYNPGYNEEAAVTTVAFTSDVGRHVPGWKSLEGDELAAAIRKSDTRTYTYPDPRLGAVELKQCSMCADRRYGLGATITDTSGGSWLDVCVGCYAKIRRRDQGLPCVWCRRQDPPRRKAEAIYFEGSPVGESWNICDGCRVGILFEEGPA